MTVICDICFSCEGIVTMHLFFPLLYRFQMQLQAITSTGLALRLLIRECKVLYSIVRYYIIGIQLVNLLNITVVLISSTTMLKGS